MVGAKNVVQSLLVAATIESQRDFSASPPEGPWAPLTLAAAFAIVSAVMGSKMRALGVRAPHPC